MVSFDIPFDLNEKIYEIKTRSDNSILKIISYFPLTKFEKKSMISIINDPNFINFNSIFTDIISNEEWNRTKSQIKKRFHDEIFNIDG